jgi:short-chain fatty acids transporter
MISAVGRALTGVSRRWMPDPFLLAVLLTFVVLIGAVAVLMNVHSFSFGDALHSTIDGWQTKLFAKGYIAFAFQMCLMLVTGHALASSPPVARLVRRLASLPETFHGGVMLVSFVACSMALIHWGLGLIVGAMIAREVGRQATVRNIPHHYPLLGAAGYTGLMIWGGGLSGSIPLKAQDDMSIDLSQTLFSAANVTFCGLMLVAIPVICLLLVPRRTDDFVPYDGSGDEDEDSEPTASSLATNMARVIGAMGGAVCAGLSIRKTGIAGVPIVYATLNGVVAGLVCHRAASLLIRFTKPSSQGTPAERVEKSELVTVLVCTMGLGWLEYLILNGQFKLTFNNLNFLFLFLGMIFQGTPIRYVRSVSEGAKGCAGIILQFPLYFGILGIIMAPSIDSGLGAVLSEKLAALGSETTYPVITYLSGGLVNLFVPSGGGQWIVQGDIVVQGAAAFPHIVPKSILALAYGDAWTNMLQPFWALPLLAITGLKARDIIGYTATVMVVGGVLTIACLFVL